MFKENEISEIADILDYFSFIEIWMNFHYYAYKDEHMQNSLEFFYNEYETEVENVENYLIMMYHARF